MIVFLCTGNICRSPMAEGYARSLFPSVEVASAGTRPIFGSRPTALARQVMLDDQIEIDSLRSSGLRADAQIVYCMTSRHLEWVRRRRPDVRAELIRPDGMDIDDPYGYDEAFYRRVRDEIKEAVIVRLGEFGGAAATDTGSEGD